jgi:hypothetical protein
MSVRIIRVNGNELHCHYSRQTSAQGCYVELDCKNETLSASYNAEIGNAIPFSVYHCHNQRWGIPALTESAANDLLDEILPLAERAVAGYESEWDGNNHVAKFDDDAQAALDEIAEICDAIEPDESNSLQEWDVGDWLDNGDKPDAETSDDDLAKMVSDAEPDDDNVVINGDIEEYFNEIRFDKRRGEIESVLDGLDTVNEYRNESGDKYDPDYVVRFENGRIAYVSYNADGKIQWRRSDLISTGLSLVALGIAECNHYRKTKPVGGDNPRRRPIEPATAYDAARCDAVSKTNRAACRDAAVKQYRDELKKDFLLHAGESIEKIATYQSTWKKISELEQQIADLKKSLPESKPTIEYFSMATNSAACRLNNLGAGMDQKELEQIACK